MNWHFETPEAYRSFFHILHFGALLENLSHNASRDFLSDTENEK